MTTHTWFRLLLVVLATSSGAFSAHAERKVALLVGNESYAGLARLANPVRDVHAMDAVLRRAGFVTQIVTDTDRNAMIEAMRTFEAQANGADIALIFYSGHGLEMNGRNFLLPVDARLKTDRDVEDETIPLSRLLRSAEGAKRLKLVILDACRDNPLVTSMDRANVRRSVNRGLVAEADAGSDTLIAYATAEKATAEDGAGANSPFTAALVQYLAEPGVDVRIALGNVRDAVRSSTNDRQTPHFYGSVGGGTIALADPNPDGRPPALSSMVPALAPPVAAAPVVDACAHANSHWEQAVKFDQLEFYEEHLRLFPTCPFASFARAKIQEKNRPQIASAPTTRAPEPAQDTAPPQRHFASFCNRPTEPIERLICSDSDLSYWDLRLEEAYRLRLARNGSAVRQAQRDWLKWRYARCDVPRQGSQSASELRYAKDCVLTMTRQRTSELEGR